MPHCDGPGAGTVGHHSEGSSSQDHGAGVQGDQTNGPQSPCAITSSGTLMSSFLVECAWLLICETVGRGRPVRG